MSPTANWIGKRLRAERLRLGLSQARLSTLVGRDKQSQMRYEAGTRSPDADYLAAVAEFGVDVNFVVTGEHTSPADVRAENQASAREWIELSEASAAIDRAETALYAAESLPVAVESSELATIQEELSQMAGQHDLPDQIRAQADWLLYHGFDDQAAAQRYRLRSKRVALSSKHALREIEDMERDIGWKPPRVLRHLLLSTHMRHHLEPEEMLTTLEAYRAAFLLRHAGEAPQSREDADYLWDH